MSRTCWRCCASSQNPRDRVAGFRLLQLLPGVGPASAPARARSHGRRRRPDRRRSAELPAPPRAGDDWTGFRRCCQQVIATRRAAGRPRSNWRAPGTSRISTASTRIADARQADLLQLEQIAGGYPSRERFLTELTLDPPDATSDQAGVPLLDEDYLILSTIHSAKGQEWKSVFVLNVVDGCIPSDLGAGTTRGDRGRAAPALCRR